MSPALVDWIRKEFGSAHLEIAASDKRKAEALKVHHATTTRRNGGIGPFPNAGIEAAAYELAGLPTDSLFDALRKVALRARALASPAIHCVKSLTHRKSIADIEEDRAREDFRAGVPGARERWIDCLTAEMRETEDLLQGLLGEGQVAR